LANFLMGIISLSISAIILANVFIYSVKNSTGCIAGNCTGKNEPAWSAAEITMWGLLTLVAIVGMLYGVMNVFGIA